MDPPGLSRLLALPLDVQRNIYRRSHNIESVLTLRRVCRVVRNAIAHIDPNVDQVARADANTEFDRDWVTSLSDDEVMRVWEHIIDRDGRDAQGIAIPGRRELQFAALTGVTVLVTYPQTHLAIALLRSLERRNTWFVDRLTSPTAVLVPIHVTNEDALRLEGTLYNAAHKHLGWVNVRLKVEGRHETMAQVRYHHMTEHFLGPRGVVLDLRNVLYPPDESEPPAVLVLPAPGPLPANFDGAPITLHLGTPPGIHASPYRFVIGLKDLDPGLLLGINPHADSWDELVIDSFRVVARAEDFIIQLLDLPLVDMNQTDHFMERPLYRACSARLPRVIAKMLERPEIDVSLPEPPWGILTPLNLLARDLSPEYDNVFGVMVDHPSMVGVHDFAAFSVAVETACLLTHCDSNLVRVRRLTPNHKSVTSLLLDLVIRAGRTQLLRELLADPHTHAPLTDDILTGALMVACDYGIEPVQIVLECPASALMNRISVMVVKNFKFNVNQGRFGLASDATRQAIGDLLDARVAHLTNL